MLHDQSPRAGRQVDLLAIAEGFAVSAGGITGLRGLDERAWILLAATDLFEAWAIGWPPGGRIDLHDHGPSHGALVVVEGVLTEVAVEADRRGAATRTTRYLRPGDHRQFGSHYVHDVNNDGMVDAVSVHVYGPRLTTMTYYELDRGGRPEAVRTEEIEPVGPFDTTGVHDPA
ncbi:MAG: cysteine dioxygenase [Acidimicrobiales bacterium]